jgi:hypothetical protein
LPEIDTREFEWFLEPWPSKLRRFRQRHPRFVDLVHKLVIELQLQGKIEHLKIHQSYFGRAELYREVGHQWPGPRVCLAIYKDRYMDKRLLRHELRHEADHWNPEMHYNPEIEQRWKDCWMSAVWRGGLWSPLNVAADISLDGRRGTGGLGKEWRREDFHRALGKEHDSLFEEAWANPPTTWPAIEALAKRLLAIQRLR